VSEVASIIFLFFCFGRGVQGCWYRWGVGANTDFGTDFASPMLIHTIYFNGHILSRKKHVKEITME